MSFLTRACLPLVVLLTMPLHQGHGKELLMQRAPRVMVRLISKYEHVLLRITNFFGNNSWIYEHALSRRLVELHNRAAAKTLTGEILNLAESRQLIERIAEAGYTIAVGTCPCRRALHKISDTVPNNTDMVFGRWADEYLDHHPGMYYRISGEEALELLERFDRLGFVHNLLGYPMQERAAYVLCNCNRDVCIPMKAQIERGYPAFRKGRSVAAVDAGACLGAEECGLCLQRCHFGARMADGGVVSVESDKCYGCGLCVATCRGGATSLERKPGAELIFARNVID